MNLNILLSLLLVFSFSLCGTATAQIDVIAPKRFSIQKNENNYKIPYYSNANIELHNDSIKHAIIVVHGMNRNADDYFANMESAANHIEDSMLIVAPQLLIKSDLIEHHLDDEHLYWSSNWRSGGLSKDNDTSFPRADRISSFTILDSLILRITSNYSSLKSIVFTGHSAGGQVTGRYAAASPIADIVAEHYSIAMKYIVMNPSSYVYLNEERWIQNDVNEFNFKVPNDSNCASYNEWPYGLEDLYNYPSQFGLDSIRNMFAKRKIHFALGELDSSTTSSSLANSCSAQLLGRHRLERGSIYFQHLLNTYGEEIRNTKTIDTIIGVGHSNYSMYHSEIVQSHLFDERGIGITVVENIDTNSEYIITYDTIQIFDTVKVMDTIYTNISVLDTITFHDTILMNDTIQTIIYDTITTYNTLLDTVTFNDTIIYQDTLQVLIYDTTTIYNSDTLIITMSNYSTSLENQKLVRVKVYPNPTSYFLNIELSETGNYKLLLINHAGQQVMEKHLNENFNSLSIEHLSKGSYLLKITDLEEEYLPSNGQLLIQ